MEGSVIVSGGRPICRSSHCPNRNKCYKGRNEWKEIDFTKDCLEKPCRDWLKAEGRESDNAGVNKGRYHFETKKVVSFFEAGQKQNGREDVLVGASIWNN